MPVSPTALSSEQTCFCLYHGNVYITEKSPNSVFKIDLHKESATDQSSALGFFIIIIGTNNEWSTI